MNDDNDKSRWLNRLLSYLPTRLRPTLNDQRFQRAADTAYRSGWPPEQLAEGIQSRGYDGARNPIILAIERLEELAPIPPANTATYAAPSEAHCGRQGCICNHHDCYRGWIELPDNPAHRITPDGSRVEVQHQHRTVQYQRTAPCPICRPQLAQRINHIPPPGERTPADLALPRHERTLP